MVYQRASQTTPSAAVLEYNSTRFQQDTNNKHTQDAAYSYGSPSHYRTDRPVA